MTTLHAAVLPARPGWRYFLSLTSQRRKPGPERADRLPEARQWQVAQGQDPPDLRRLGSLHPSPWQVWGLPQAPPAPWHSRAAPQGPAAPLKLALEV